MSRSPGERRVLRCDTLLSGGLRGDINPHQNKDTPMHVIKEYGGSTGIAPFILNIGISWGEWSASRPSPFTPGKDLLPTFLLVPTQKQAGYATEPVGAFWNKEKMCQFQT
jgi:hypothetical protein